MPRTTRRRNVTRNDWHLPLPIHRFAMATTHIPPASLTKQRAPSIGSLLEPWTEEFAKYGHAKITKAKSVSRGCAVETTVVEFVLLTLSSSHTTRDEIIALRESLEVMHIAALMDVRDVEEALSGLSYHDFEQSDPDDVAPAQGSSSTEGNEGSVRFVLTFYGTSGRFLDQVIAPVLFTDCYERSQAFRDTVNAIGWDASTFLMPLQCHVNLISMDNDFEDEPEVDYIERVVSFIQQLDGRRLTKKNDKENGPENVERVDIHVMTVELDLNQMGVSKSVIDAVAQLKDVALPVRCSRVALDPRGLSCSSDELSFFLENIGAKASEMTVEIGHVLACEPTESLEGNLEELIEKIFRGIAGASCVTCVSFGPLLAMMDSLKNRQVLWTELLSTLASESSKAKISSLVLSPQIQLLEEDAVFINEAVAASGRELHVKSIMLWMSGSSPASVQALIKAMGARAETMTLQNEVRGVSTSETVACIANECPNLRDLTLSGVDIDNLSTFAVKTPLLRSLSLISVTVDKTDSVSDLFTTLADPSSSLATNLHSLQVKVANHIPHTLVVGSEEADLVVEILKNNKTLRHLELTMSDETTTTTMAAIHKHDNEVLSEPLLVSQKLAFLSVIQPACGDDVDSCRNRVDQDVIQLILDFAAERVLRRVDLDW